MQASTKYLYKSDLFRQSFRPDVYVGIRKKVCVSKCIFIIYLVKKSFFSKIKWKWNFPMNQCSDRQTNPPTNQPTIQPTDGLRGEE